MTAAVGRNPKVDEALRRATRWRHEADALREVLLECGLTEEFKWRKSRERRLAVAGRTHRLGLGSGLPLEGRG